MKEGEHMRVTTMIKIRVIHAFLRDSHRDKLRTMYNSLKRKSINERSSNACELTIWQKCCDNYNDSLWEPYST